MKIYGFFGNGIIKRCSEFMQGLVYLWMCVYNMVIRLSSIRIWLEWC